MRFALLLFAAVAQGCGARSALTEGDFTRDASVLDAPDTFVPEPPSDSRIAECIEGTVESVACGRCGTRSRQCFGGAWTSFSECTGEGACNPFDEETTTASCPPMESRVRTCTETCSWGPFSACARRGWISIATPESLGYLGRYEHVAVWTGSEMLIWSGRTRNLADKLQEGAAYNLATGTWRLLPDSPIGSRHGPWVTAVWTGSTMIVWGGRGTTAATSALMPDGAELDPKTNTWFGVPPSPLGGRSYVRGVWTPATRELVVWGGSDGTKGYSDGAAYSPAKRSWRVIAKSPLSPRINHALLAVGDKILVHGGRTTGDVTAPDGALYDPATDSWSMLPAAPGYAGGVRPQTGADGDRAAVFAGISSTNTGAWFDARTGVWSAIPEPPGAVLIHIDDPALTWMGANRFWFWMPFWGDGDPHFAAFHLPTATWVRHPESLLDPRQGATVVWTGREAILWGGCCKPAPDDDKAFADGAIYRP